MPTAQLIESVMFWAFGLVAVVAALGVVFHRSIVYSALMLITVFLSIAGVYVLNNADFLAIAQILIYAVGLTIIILFAIMFTGDKQFGFDRRKVTGLSVAAVSIVALYLLAMLVRTAWYPFADDGTLSTEVASGAFAAIPVFGSTNEIGRLLFTKYSPPFELASILLLVAMIGAIVLSKQSFDEETRPNKFAIADASAPTPEALAGRMAHWEAYKRRETKEGAQVDVNEANEDTTPEGAAQ